MREREERERPERRRGAAMIEEGMGIHFPTSNIILSYYRTKTKPRSGRVRNDRLSSDPRLRRRQTLPSPRPPLRFRRFSSPSPPRLPSALRARLVLALVSCATLLGMSVPALSPVDHLRDACPRRDSPCGTDSSGPRRRFRHPLEHVHQRRRLRRVRDSAKPSSRSASPSSRAATTNRSPKRPGFDPGARRNRNHHPLRRNHHHPPSPPPPGSPSNHRLSPR